MLLFVVSASMMVGTFIIDAVAPMWGPLPYFYWATIGLLLAANIVIPAIALRLAKQRDARVLPVKRVLERILWGGAIGALVSVMELTRGDKPPKELGPPSAPSPQPSSDT